MYHICIDNSDSYWPRRFLSVSGLPPHCWGRFKDGLVWVGDGWMDGWVSSVGSHMDGMCFTDVLLSVP
eukprot:8296122-Alexandrium_andersonii.AAC.1